MAIFGVYIKYSDFGYEDHTVPIIVWAATHRINELLEFLLPLPNAHNYSKYNYNEVAIAYQSGIQIPNNSNVTRGPRILNMSNYTYNFPIESFKISTYCRCIRDFIFSVASFSIPLEAKISLFEAKNFASVISRPYLTRILMD